jgi:Tir chaperone family protein CesT
MHHSEAYSPLLLMYCDFGPVPKDMEAQIYKQLLEMNLTAYSGQGETFCLSPEGRVIYVNNFLVEVLTPELLASYMAFAAAYAKKWREGAFFPPGGKKPARPHFMTGASK